MTDTVQNTSLVCHVQLTTNGWMRVLGGHCSFANYTPTATNVIPLSQYLSFLHIKGELKP